GGGPICCHRADGRWALNSDPAMVFWEGETRQLGEGLTLIRCGGHFDGGTVLHWAAGADGRGVLLSGDILQVCADRRHVSFMYSYPNYIPLRASAVVRVERAVEPFAYERIYGAWGGRGGTGSSPPTRGTRWPARWTATCGPSAINRRRTGQRCEPAGEGSAMSFDASFSDREPSREEVDQMKGPVVLEFGAEW